MTITLLAFGNIADILNSGMQTLNDIPDTNYLITMLHAQFPALGTTTYSVAVNKNIVHQNTTLHNNDTVALLPPFSGG